MNKNNLVRDHNHSSFRFLGQVHHAIRMRSASATAISSRITHIAAILLFAASCTSMQSPPQCPVCPVCPACPQPAKPVAEQASYEPAEFAALPGWQSATLLPGVKAFIAGCARIAATSPLRKACDAARRVDSLDEAGARRFIESAFSLYSISAPDRSTQGLVTGYYEPILAGSRNRTATSRFPVYGVPDDLVVVDLAEQHPDLRGLRLRGRIEGRRLVPYWSRAEFENRGRASDGVVPGVPVLAWVRDPVELFFLQIQGSGQIQLESGERLRLGYADQNGHAYRSLGRYLIDRGELTLEQSSMQGIRAWAQANPQKLADALNSNPSYVFFRASDSTSGPIGSLGVPLTAGYSIAVDPRFVPLGAPVFLATTMPLSTQPLERLVVAQDTGGAIRGAVRADFFWGTGDSAGAHAGRMRQQGAMWLLWPRGDPPPTSSSPPRRAGS
jgi:membrane-bound lytic murein transglycosylase A